MVSAWKAEPIGHKSVEWVGLGSEADACEQEEERAVRNGQALHCPNEDTVSSQ